MRQVNLEGDHKKIIHKIKQKTEYPIPQEFLELTKHEGAVEYQVGRQE